MAIEPGAAPTEQRGNRWTRAILQARLSGTRKAILHALIPWVDWKASTATVFRDGTALAAEAGISRGKLWGHLRALEGAGILTPTRKPGGRGIASEWTIDVRAIERLANCPDPAPIQRAAAGGKLSRFGTNNCPDSALETVPIRVPNCPDPAPHSWTQTGKETQTSPPSEQGGGDEVLSLLREAGVWEQNAKRLATKHSIAITRTAIRLAATADPEHRAGRIVKALEDGTAEREASRVGQRRREPFVDPRVEHYQRLAESLKSPAARPVLAEGELRQIMQAAKTNGHVGIANQQQGG